VPWWCNVACLVIPTVLRGGVLAMLILCSAAQHTQTDPHCDFAHHRPAVCVLSLCALVSAPQRSFDRAVANRWPLRCTKGAICVPCTLQGLGERVRKESGRSGKTHESVGSQSEAKPDHVGTIVVLPFSFAQD
jgi:hypothetical protein